MNKKVTFTMPTYVLEKLRKAVPKGKRSDFVSDVVGTYLDEKRIETENNKKDWKALLKQAKADADFRPESAKKIIKNIKEGRA